MFYVLSCRIQFCLCGSWLFLCLTSITQLDLIHNHMKHWLLFLGSIFYTAINFLWMSASVEYIELYYIIVCITLGIITTILILFQYACHNYTAKSNHICISVCLYTLAQILKSFRYNFDITLMYKGGIHGTVVAHRISG